MDRLFLSSAYLGEGARCARRQFLRKSHGCCRPRRTFLPGHIMGTSVILSSPLLHREAANDLSHRLVPGASLLLGTHKKRFAHLWTDTVCYEVSFCDDRAACTRPDQTWADLIAQSQGRHGGVERTARARCRYSWLRGDSISFAFLDRFVHGRFRVSRFHSANSWGM